MNAIDRPWTARFVEPRTPSCGARHQVRRARSAIYRQPDPGCVCEQFTSTGFTLTATDRACGALASWLPRG